MRNLLKTHYVLSPKWAAAVVFLGFFLVSQTGSAEVLFKESFDDLDDWTSTMHTTANEQTVVRGDIIPDGWWGIYQGTVWSPELGYPDNHPSLEILSRNADKARGNRGKSAVFWRESHSRGWNNWASDAHFVKLFNRDYEQLYIEFYIRFSDNWWQRNPANAGGWTSKIFRVGHWSREGSIWNSQTGDVNPRMFWDYKKDNYGVRNVLALRHGPPGKNETISHSGSKNYTTHTVGQQEKGQPEGLLNALNTSQLLSEGGAADHEDVFGKPETWTKVAFFVKMNSAPGVADGVLRQWVNDQRIVNYEDVEWLKSYPGASTVGWNYIAIGGNDFFQAYPNERRFEDWYAIDDLIVATDPMVGKAEGVPPVAPNPPSNISITN